MTNEIRTVDKNAEKNAPVQYAVVPPMLVEKILALKDRKLNIHTRRNHRNALDAIKNELEKAIRDFDAKDH
jgi:hypothetical protein